MTEDAHDVLAVEDGDEDDEDDQGEEVGGELTWRLSEYGGCGRRRRRRERSFHGWKWEENCQSDLLVS